MSRLCLLVIRPSTEEALKEIEAAMRSIEAARSPTAAAAAAAQLRTYHNSAFWDPSTRTAPVTHPVSVCHEDIFTALKPKI